MPRTSRAPQPTASPQTALEQSRLRQVGIVLICAKVALVPLLFDQPADLPFTVPKALASHALAYALIGVIAGLAIRFGRSVLIRSWLHAPVLAFLIASVLAAVFAEDRLLALYGSHDRMVGLVTIADQVVLYFAIALLVRRQRELAAVMLAALGSSLLILAYE